MDIKKIFIDGLNNIQNNKFEIDAETLNKFIENHKIEILNKEQLNLKNKDIKENTISFIQGFSISILNPKILIWFIAIYSQFMSVNNNLIFNITLISIAGIVDACWYIILTLAVTAASALRFFQSKIKFIQKTQGFLFIALGLGLLVNLSI